MKTLLGSLLVLGLWASPALAAFFVCESPARSACAATAGLDHILPSIDATLVTDPVCFQVPEAQVAAQKTVLQTVAASHANGRCHLKVVGGLAVEMSGAEKGVVDAAIQAAMEDRQAYEDLATNNDLCNATRQELDQKKADFLAALRVDIAGISTIATAKTELDDMMVKITNAFGKVLDCLRGRAGPPQ